MSGNCCPTSDAVRGDDHADQARSPDRGTGRRRTERHLPGCGAFVLAIVDGGASRTAGCRTLQGPCRSSWSGGPPSCRSRVGPAGTHAGCREHPHGAAQLPGSARAQSESVHLERGRLSGNLCPESDARWEARMTRMMRGHTYSCGCCHSYGRGQQRSRRDDDREMRSEIREELGGGHALDLPGTLHRRAAGADGWIRPPDASPLNSSC